MARSNLGWIIVATVVAVGCGGSVGTDGGTADGGGGDAAPTDGSVDAGPRDASNDAPAVDLGGDAGPVGTAHVVASVGGTVTSDDGLFTLIIPPGALAADTDIGVRTVPPAERPPEAATTVSGVYELTPDGLTFLVPARGVYSFTTPPPGTVPPGGVGLFEEHAISGGTTTSAPRTTSLHHADDTLTVEAELAHLSTHFVSAYIGSGSSSIGMVVAATLPSGDQPLLTSLPSSGWTLFPGGTFGSPATMYFSAHSEPTGPVEEYLGPGWTSEPASVTPPGTAAESPSAMIATSADVGTLAFPPAWTCRDATEPSTEAIWACLHVRLGGGAGNEVTGCVHSSIHCVAGVPTDVGCASLPYTVVDTEDLPPGTFDRAGHIDYVSVCDVSSADPAPPYTYAAAFGTTDTGALFLDAYAGPYRLYATDVPVDRSYARALPTAGTPFAAVLRDTRDASLFRIDATASDGAWTFSSIGPSTGPLPHEPGKLACGEPASFTVGTTSAVGTAYVHVCHDGVGSFGICTLQTDAACSGRLIELGIRDTDGLGYAVRGSGHTITSHSAGTGSLSVTAIPLGVDVTFVVDGTITIVASFSATGVNIVSVDPS